MKKINLGAGVEKKEGWISLDKYTACNPDIVWDLEEKGTVPFEDDEIDEFMANQLLEHIHGDMFIPLMNDCYRALKPGGLFRIECPYGVTPARLCDPTHKSYIFFTEWLGNYFNQEKLVALGLFKGYGGITCNFKEEICERHGVSNHGIRYVWRALK